MRGRLLIYISFFTFFFVCATQAKAVSISTPSTFSTSASFINDEQKTISVTVSSSGSLGAGWLKALFYQSGTSTKKYFGSVVGDQNCTASTSMSTADQSNCFSIPGAGTFSITVSPDMSSANYPGNQDGEFIVYRCTASGCDSTQASTPIDVHFVDTQSTSTPTPTSIAVPSPTATPGPVPPNIALSEVMACPPTGQNEWVEIVNNNNTGEDLENWEIKDSTETNKQAFSATVQAHSWYVVQIVNAMLNNSGGDTVRLVDPNGNTVESFGYNSCASDQSWSKNSSGTWQSTTPTPGGANQFPTPSPTPLASAPIIPTAAGTTLPSPTLEPTAEGADASMSGEVLGTESTSDPISTPQDTPIASQVPLVSDDSSSPPPLAFIALIIGGGALVTLGGYIWWEGRKKKK
ncbi:hypothetical protein C5B42_00885 [Candidatus Cerribacteria bacterium 'Amazon FNV 2010 28 9']|uniref:LTD domain-containing protein n=1 Tax=Candidatus Cerribacteria bacterium 'Amazon FNV 2010 28 9' TaxID=2081795 RepID=A0A317JU20_9BACT|nr:MAG: hypothetical protein C5B42_00885 [Candidatus Cerribacteria bacterium 'Amazon FNV 2010 28 9']